MNTIKQLVEYLTPQKLQRIKIVGTQNSREDYTDKLYRLLINSPNLNDEEIAQYFFQKSKNYKPYRQLKIRCSDHLINAVLLVDLENDLTSFQRAYAKTVKQVAAAKILLSRGFFKPAISITLDNYKRAKRYGFNDELIACCEILRDHYGHRENNPTLYSRYNKSFESISNTIKLEKLARKNFIEYVLNHYSKRCSKEELSKCAREKFIELEPHMSSCLTYKFQYFARYLRIVMYSSVNDHTSVISYASQDIKYFLENHVGHMQSIINSLIQKSKACIRVGEYEEGLQAARGIVGMVKKSNQNWFFAKYYEFLIYMHKEDYEKARDIYSEYLSNRFKSNLLWHLQEDWKIAGAYIALLQESGLTNEKANKRFRVNKFLNEVPEYSKDRKVAHIPILVAHILFLLRRNKTDELIDRAEVLKQYCGRNLTHDQAGRANMIIKMLLKIPEKSFNRIAVERHTKGLKNRLYSTSYTENKKNYFIEPLPYEKVWEVALECLG